MQAQKNLVAGEKLWTEKPLAQLPVGLSNTHDPKRFYNVQHKHSGAPTLDILCEQMSYKDRTALDALRNHGEDTTGLFATNAFGDDYKDNGLTYRIFRIYKDIPRINHSCRPNAVLTWNPQIADGEGRGTLYAIRTIGAGEDITIDYLSSEENALLKIGRRLKNLKDSWQFDCKCGARAGPLKEVREEDRVRSKALKLFNSFHEDVVYEDETTEGAWSRRVKDCEEYVEILRGTTSSAMLTRSWPRWMRPPSTTPRQCLIGSTATTVLRVGRASSRDRHGVE